VFTARYALSPDIKQIRFVFKGLKVDSDANFLQSLVRLGAGLDAFQTRKKSLPLARNQTSIYGCNI
jgi:hypothetical protein